MKSELMLKTKGELLDMAAKLKVDADPSLKKEALIDRIIAADAAEAAPEQPAEGEAAPEEAAPEELPPETEGVGLMRHAKAVQTLVHGSVRAPTDAPGAPKTTVLGAEDKDRIRKMLDLNRKLEGEIDNHSKYEAELVSRLADRDTKIAHLERVIASIEGKAGEVKRLEARYNDLLEAISDAISLWSNKVCVGCGDYRGEGNPETVGNCISKRTCPAKVFSRTLNILIRGVLSDGVQEEKEGSDG